MTKKQEATLENIKKNIIKIHGCNKDSMVSDVAMINDNLCVAFTHGYVADNMVRIEPDGVAKYAHPFGTEFQEEEIVIL